MNPAPMSYKHYVWPRNPETLRTERARNIAEFPIPGETGVVQENGVSPRKTTGTGRFTGEDAAEEYARLSAVFAEGGSGTLRLPCGPAFQAVFSRLVMKGVPRPGCVEYEFTFMEDVEDSASGEGNVDTCTEDDTLWDIANRHGVSVDELLAANPQIEWPNALRSGEEIVVP